MNSVVGQNEQTQEAAVAALPPADRVISSDQSLLSYKNEGRGYSLHDRKWMSVEFWTSEPDQRNFRKAERGMLLHRAQRPAVIWENGTEEYWSNGQLHRADFDSARESYKPAFLGADGSLGWWVHGVQHRIDGPACILPDGEVHWKMWGEFNRKDGPAWSHPDGSYSWYRDGKRHRDGDEPAARILTQGAVRIEWCKEGQLSRTPSVGPAVITRYEDGGGRDEYAVVGMRHNFAGAADIRRYANGRVSRKYYVFGEQISRAELVELRKEKWFSEAVKLPSPTPLVEVGFSDAYLLN